MLFQFGSLLRDQTDTARMQLRLSDLTHLGRDHRLHHDRGRRGQAKFTWCWIQLPDLSFHFSVQKQVKIIIRMLWGIKIDPHCCYSYTIETLISEPITSWGARVMSWKAYAQDHIIIYNAKLYWYFKFVDSVHSIQIPLVRKKSIYFIVIQTRHVVQYVNKCAAYTASENSRQ